MQLVDTHVHLEDQAFAADRLAVIERAQADNVNTMINAGSTASANRAVLALAQKTPGLYGSVGLHPHEFPSTSEATFSVLQEQLGHEKVVALGEIGLDYHVFPDYPPPDRKAQQEAFARQLQLARIFELPLIIHVREAYSDALQLLREYGPFINRGVMHCYAGGMEYLKDVLDLGFYIGVGGPVTYPKAESVREVVRAVPDDRLLLETDAPYLPPQSRRGKRNEPACIKEIAKACAALRGTCWESLAEQTTANAFRLFKIEAKSAGVFTYNIKGHLYVNLTNRCSADCVFCPRRIHRRVQEYELTLQREPLARELIEAIGDPRQWAEIVFCGFGEPVLRLPTLLQVARAVKAKGGRIRVDTNGHADIIFGRDILPECQGLVDEWSISLNSADPQQYEHLVRPAGGRQTYPAVIAFIERAVKSGFTVTVTAVELSEIDSKSLQQLTQRLGARYRGRIYQRLGEPEVR